MLKFAELAKMPIGDRLKALREEKGLTQMELATKAGIQSGMVAKIEQGRTKDPRWFTVVAIAEALGIATDALRDPPKKKKDS